MSQPVTTTPPALPSLPAAIGVGVGILVWRGGRLLLGRRLATLGHGSWAGPGGKLEFGETVLQAAARELAEETGLQLGPAEPGPYSLDHFPALGQQHVTLFVIARHTVGEVRNLEPDKCAGWQWFSPAELPAPLFAPVASLLAAGFPLA